MSSAACQIRNSYVPAQKPMWRTHLARLDLNTVRTVTGMSNLCPTNSGRGSYSQDYREPCLVITIDRAPGIYGGEPSAFHRPLVPLRQSAPTMPMVFVGTGLQGVDQLNVHFR